MRAPVTRIMPGIPAAAILAACVSMGPLAALAQSPPPPAAGAGSAAATPAVTTLL